MVAVVALGASAAQDAQPLLAARLSSPLGVEGYPLVASTAQEAEPLFAVGLGRFQPQAAPLLLKQQEAYPLLHAEQGPNLQQWGAWYLLRAGHAQACRVASVAALAALLHTDQRLGLQPQQPGFRPQVGPLLLKQQQADAGLQQQLGGAHACFIMVLSSSMVMNATSGPS